MIYCVMFHVKIRTGDSDKVEQGVVTSILPVETLATGIKTFDR